MVNNKNQHFVPASYLQAWADPNRPQYYDPFVHIFNKDGKNHKKKAPGKILREPEIYTIFADGKRDISIEKYFGKGEQDFVRARRLIAKDKPLGVKEIVALYAFVAGMLVRPPHKIDHTAGQWASIADKARTIKINPNVAPTPRLNISKEPSFTIEEVQRMADDPMGTWFGPSLNVYLKVLTELFGCEILINCSPHPFLTSDNPAVVYFADEDPNRKFWSKGLGASDCEITMPISSSHALRFTRKSPGVHDWKVLDWEAVFEVNFLTITRARRKIISDREDLFFVKTILDLVATVEAE